MDELFETLLTLVPIALFIALRVVASNRKKSETAERGKLQAFLASRMKAPPPTAKPILAESAPISGDAVFRPVPAGLPTATGAAPSAAALSPRVPDATTHPPKAKSGPAPRFPANLDYLSPLRRAVVLAEILGPPKGL